MNDDRIHNLEREVAKLRAELATLRRALERESNSTTFHIQKICRHINGIDSYLNPIIYKVLPQFAATRRQVDTILGAPKSTDEDTD